MSHPKIAWIIVDKVKAGSLAQCLSLSTALGYTPVIKKISLRFPYSLISPYIRAGILKWGGVANELTPPYPDLIIASGRQAAGLAAALFHKFKGHNTKVVFVLDPYISSKNFDALILPRHDKREGNNICTILGALHGLTPEKLAHNAAVQFTDVKNPTISVLIGGDSQHFTYTRETLQIFRDRIYKLKEKLGAKSLLITPSRRTRTELLPYIHELFQSPGTMIWDFKESNPYPAMLGAADVIVATSDSISMTSEACGSGKPVFIEDLKIAHPKFISFFQDIFNMGYAHKLEDINHFSTIPPTKILNEIGVAVNFLKDRKVI